MTGSHLPTDQAAAACARIEDLAKAAKRAGHPGRVGNLRADLYLGLLAGRWQHLTRDQIIADLLAHAAADSTSDPDPAAPVERDDRADNAAPTDHDGAVDRDGAVNHETPADCDGPAGGDDLGGVTAVGGGLAAGPAVRVGVELRVGLSTLLGRDHHPGEIPGWRPIGTELARTMVTAQRGAPWCFAITDDFGCLVFAGITRRRPHTDGAESAPCRGCGAAHPRKPAHRTRRRSR